jgi:hypothetical protein
VISSYWPGFQRFNKLLLLLARIFGWKWQDLLCSRRQVGENKSAKESIPQRELALIAERNELGIKLYQCARQVSEESIREQGDVFEEEVRILEEELKHFNSRPGVVVHNWVYGLPGKVLAALKSRMRRMGVAIGGEPSQSLRRSARLPQSFESRVSVFCIPWKRWGLVSATRIACFSRQGVDVCLDTQEKSGRNSTRKDMRRRQRQSLLAVGLSGGWTNSHPSYWWTVLCTGS